MSRLFRELGIEMTTKLMQFLARKEKRKQYKKKYDERMDIKARRSNQQRKNREEVLKERTNNAYGSGVGLTAGIRKQGRGNAKRNSNMCKCGNKTHARTTHNQCPMNKKQKITNIDSAFCPPHSGN
jgi:hypothetical protein